MGFVTSGPTAIMKSEDTAVSVMQVPMLPASCSLCLAPKYWDTIMPAPVDIPTNKTNSKLSTGEALPTAASALSPTYFPTTMESTVLYNCWAMLPISMGIANKVIFFQGTPSVMSVGANSFLSKFMIFSRFL